MNPKSLPYNNWPELNRNYWRLAVASGDRFDGRGPAAHWSLASCHSIRYAYGRWLMFIETIDPDLFNGSPSSRITRPLFRQYILQLQSEVKAATVFIYLDQLLCAIQVMFPDENWSWIRIILRRLKRDVPPRAKLHRLVDSNRLFDLGIELMEEPKRLLDTETNSQTLNRAILYRDGLLIAILSLRPIRRRTLTLIRIGDHLQNIGQKYHFVFRPADTKNRKPLEYPLPDLLTDYLDRYLRRYRRLIPGSENHAALWASAKGNPLSSGSIYRQIMKRTKAAFGVAISPHLFRDCAATTLATYQPDQVLVGAGLLGHSDLRAIHSHYIHAQTIKAGKAHQNAINALRGSLQTRRR